MSGAAGTTTPESFLASGDALRHQRRRAIEEAYEAAYKRTIRRDTLTALEDLVCWLDECHSGEVVFTTALRADEEIGWPVGTGNYATTSNRVRKSIYRRLDMLVEMGWISDWSGVSSKDRGNVGILIRPRRDSSVGEALSLAPSPRQLSFAQSFRVVEPQRMQVTGLSADMRVPSGPALRLLA